MKNTVLNSNEDFKEINADYWTERSETYSDKIIHQLEGEAYKIWASEFSRQFVEHFGPKFDSLKVLDCGCGPGFFSIVLSQLGHTLTGIDISQGMIEHAKSNVKKASVDLKLIQMDAQALNFEDESFDVLVTRNLTWNLPDPKAAYKEWLRVLKPGGLLLNYDANWYNFLFDDALKEAFIQDRKNTVNEGVEDFYAYKHSDEMEDLARRVPLSKIHRPKWDKNFIESLGHSVKVDECAGDYLWTEVEKVNSASTPLFSIAIRKSDT